MDWRLKLLGQKAIDVTLPGRLGLSVHQRFQSAFGKVGNFNTDIQNYHVQRGTGIAKFVEQHSDFRFEGSRVLEIGTGWSGSDCILFHLLGAEEVWTFDLLPHLEMAIVKKMICAFRQIPRFRERCESLLDLNDLSVLLDACRIRYVAPSEFYKHPFPKHYFDLFYSYSVLQRIPVNDLRRCLKTAQRALRQNGYALNVIHHYDHNARHQKSLNEFHYLRYPDAIYKTLQSKRFNFQNRLRHCELLTLFEECGFRTVTESLAHGTGTPKLAKRFQGIPMQDVLIKRTQLLSQTY